MERIQTQNSNQQVAAALAAAAEARRQLKKQRGAKFLQRAFTPNWHPRDMPFCKMIRQQVLARIPDMQAGVRYTLKQICGEEFWSRLGSGEVLKAGLYVAWMVRQDQLPLVQGEDKSASHTYILKFNAYLQEVMS